MTICSSALRSGTKTWTVWTGKGGAVACSHSGRSWILKIQTCGLPRRLERQRADFAGAVASQTRSIEISESSVALSEREQCANAVSEDSRSRSPISAGYNNWHHKNDADALRIEKKGKRSNSPIR